MLKPKSNPFYVALVVVGVAFAITACAYGMMTVVKLKPQPGKEHPLVTLMDQRGLTILLSELGVLAVLTFAAIGTDDYWTEEKKPDDSQK